MKVKELIELLKDMPQDLEVYSMCDHGQSPEKSMNPSIAWAEDLDDVYDGNWSADEEDSQEYGYTKAFVLL